MANAHVLGGGKWKKALEAVSKQAASLKVGVLEGATSEDGESVATYAFYNEFGATVEVPERTQTLYFKRNRDGTVGNRFVRKDKSDFAQDVAVGGHTISIPARPFMRSTVQAQKDAWAKAFADAFVAKAGRHRGDHQVELGPGQCRIDQTPQERQGRGQGNAHR